MNSQPSTTVDELMKRIRAKLSRPSAASPAADTADPAAKALSHTAVDTSTLSTKVANAHQQAFVWTTTPKMDHYRGIVRLAAGAVGKAILFLTQPITKRQQESNLATVHVLQLLGDAVRSIDHDLSAVITRANALSTIEERLAADISALKTYVANLDARTSILPQLQQQIADAHRQRQELREDTRVQIAALNVYLTNIDVRTNVLPGLQQQIAEARVELQAMKGLVEQVGNHTRQLESLPILQSQMHDANRQIGDLHAALGPIQSRLSVLQHLEERIRDFENKIQRLPVIEAIGTQNASSLEESRAALRALDPRLAQLQEYLPKLMMTIVNQERRLGKLLEEARSRLPKPFDQQQLHVLADELTAMDDQLYVAFEDRFRGSREDIKERVKIYLPIIQKANAGTKKCSVLDVGCGRGEWLELLKENNLVGYGVDLNKSMVEYCQAAGLKVSHGDVLAYLRKVDDASLGAVTGFHIIEHLPFGVWVRLFDEAFRVLKPGGVLIFETPNPENVQVGSNSFYYDPTHLNPLPLHLVKFVAEYRGFSQTEVLRLHPFDDAVLLHDAGETATRLNALFYGPQDYAVIGWKPK